MICLHLFMIKQSTRDNLCDKKKELDGKREIQGNQLIKFGLIVPFLVPYYGKNTHFFFVKVIHDGCRC